MSLIHWWSLNGNLKDVISNNDLQDIIYDNDLQDIINNKDVIIPNTNGKIGSCYERTKTGTTNLLRTKNKLKAMKEESICAWVYVSQHAVLNTANGLVSNHNHATNSGLGIGVFTSDGNNYYISINAGNGSSRTHSSYYGRTNIKNAWHHVCMVSDGSTIRLYVDGKEDRDPLPYTLLSKEEYLDIFNWSIGYATYPDYRPICKINDVRVYDHALSEAEVKELSKGLVVHYTFNDTLIENTINLIPSSLQNMVVNTSTNAGSAATYEVTSGLTQGAYYTLSSYITRSSSDTSTNPRLTLILVYSDGTSTQVNQYYNTEGTNFPKDNKEYYYVAAAKADSSKTLTRVWGWLLDHSSGSGKIISYRNAQLETKDHATPYTPGSRSSLLYNETGLAQPSTKNNIVLSTDSGVGTYSLNCQGSTEIATSNICDISQGTTASFWVKGNVPTDSRLVFADSNSKTAFGFFNNGQAIITCAGYGHACVSNIKTGWKTGWNHIVVTRDSSGTVSCYLNNNKLALSGSQEWTHTIENTLSIGCRYNGGWTSYYTGLIDDFRFYATCLSVDDIKDLYQTKAYISDKGDIMCTEFIEGKTQAQVTSKGKFEANEFYEEIDEGYEVLEYIENASVNNLQGHTPSIDTGIIPKLPFKAVAEITTVNTAASNEDGVLLGVNSNGSFIPFYIYQGKWHCDDLGVRIGDAPNNTYFKAEYDATTSQRITTINGVQNVYNGTKTLPDASLWVMNGHWAGQQLNRGANVKLHKLTIVNEGKLERYYIPVRQKSTGKVGLYDCVYKVFYEENSGSSIPFTAGNTLTNSNASIYDNQNVSGRNLIEI